MVLMRVNSCIQQRSMGRAVAPGRTACQEAGASRRMPWVGEPGLGPQMNADEPKRRGGVAGRSASAISHSLCVLICVRLRSFAANILSDLPYHNAREQGARWRPFPSHPKLVI